jgi:hypothetical protein|nr:RNA helicase [uncultured Flavobacterium sp.]
MTEKNTPKINSIKKNPVCGIVMPISPIDNCSAEHWSEVLTILKEVIKDANFEPNLVSDADDSGIIQKRIIQNLYKNEIVICDVSAKNPNVMFELGMRLAFDKPTIIIKDDKTDYSFDTSVIEHVGYPRDLRFSKILKFKETLKLKIESTYQKSKNDPNYTTFLKHFGEYKITQLEQTEVSSEKYILSAIEDINRNLREIKYNQIENKPPFHSNIYESKAYNIVRKEIEKFKVKNKIKGDLEILNDENLKINLFDYLEKLDIIRSNCDGPEELKHLMNENLIPF